MADIDSLSIQISASSSQATTAIDKLVGHLKTLNTALNNYSDSSNYVKGLTNLSNGLNGIADAVARIDTAKIKDVSSVLKSLSGAGDKLSKLTFAKSLTEMGAEAQKASNEVKKTAKEIAVLFEFDKDKQGVEELTNALQKLFSATDNTAKGDALKGVENVISGFSNAGKEIDETRVKLGEFIRSLDIKLPENIVSELGEDFKYLRGYMGISNTSYKKGAMTEGDFADALRNAGFTQFEGIENEVELFRKVAEYLRDTSAEMVNENAVAETLADTMERLAESVGYVKEQTESLDFSWMDKVGGDDIVFGDPAQVESISRGAEQAQEAVSGLNEQVQQMEQTFSQIQNPFEGLVSGLESLQGINISAEQFAGVATVTSFVGSLKGISGSSDILSNVAVGLKDLSAIVIPKMDELEELAKNLRSLGSGQIQNAAWAIPELADALRSLMGVEIPNFGNLAMLGNALSSFRNSRGRASSIERLPEILRQAEDSMDEFRVKVSQEITPLETYEEEIERIFGAIGVYSNVGDASGLQYLSESVSSMLGQVKADYADATDTIQAYETAIEQINQAIASIGNLSAEGVEANAARVQEMYREIAGVSESEQAEIEKLESSIERVRARMDDFLAMGGSKDSVIFIGMEQELDSILAKLEKVKKESSDIKSGSVGNTGGLVGPFESLMNSMKDIWNNRDMLGGMFNRGISSLGENIANVFSRIRDAISGATRSGANMNKILPSGLSRILKLAGSIPNPIKAIGKGISNIAYKFGRMVKMFQLMLIRKALYAVITGINDAMKSLAQFDGEVGTRFNDAMSLMISDFKWIGGNITAMFAPLVTAVVPILDALISKIVEVITYINQLFAFLTGSPTFAVAKKNVESYSDSLSNAAGSAQKLNKQLRGIDELNNLTLNDGSGRGGSSGGDAGSYIWEEFETPEWDGDWYALGQKVRDYIVNGLNSIDWGSIQEKTRKVALAFSDFLNGLFSPDENGVYVLGDAIGRFLAESLNTGVDFFLTFGENFHWKDLGHTIATGVNTFFSTFDFGELAQTINVWVEGIFDLLISGLEGTDWGQIGRKISEFINGIDWSGIAFDLGKFADRIITAATDYVRNLSWEDFGRNIVDFICGIDWKQLNFDLWRFAGALWDALVDTVKGVFKEIADDPAAVGEFIVNFAGIAFLLNGVKLTKALILSTLRTALGVNAASGLAKSAGVGSLGVLGQASLLVAASWLGFEGGKTLGEFLFPDDEEWYKGFKWTGDGGFFQVTISAILEGDAIPAIMMMAHDDVFGIFSTGIENAAIGALALQEGLVKLTAEPLWNVYGAFAALAKIGSFIPGPIGEASKAFAETFAEMDEYYRTPHEGGGAGHSFDVAGESAEELTDKLKGLKPGLDTTRRTFKNTSDGIIQSADDMETSVSASATEMDTNVGYQFQSMAEKITREMKSSNDSVTLYSTDISRTMGVQFGLADTETATKFGRMYRTISDNMSYAYTSADTNGIKIKNTLSMSFNSASTETNSKFKVISDSISSWMSTAADKVKGYADKISKHISGINFSSLSDDISKTTSSVASVKVLTPAKFAGGGFPQVGSVFIAGEAGAEILGTVGGKTAVAGGAEITGIRDAINQASATETALLRALISAVESGGTITIDGKSLARSIRQADREYYNRTGVGMFAH